MYYYYYANRLYCEDAVVDKWLVAVPVGGLVAGRTLCEVAVQVPVRPCCRVAVVVVDGIS